MERTGEIVGRRIFSSGGVPKAPASWRELSGSRFPDSLFRLGAFADLSELFPCCGELASRSAAQGISPQAIEAAGPVPRRRGAICKSSLSISLYAE